VPDPAEISVVIPVRNGAGTVGSCLDALLRQDGVGRVEVLVVDNGSTDATADVVRRHPLGARLLTESRPGSYAARNAGIDAAAAPVLAFTDADCRPAAGWLAAGVARLTGADLVGGAVRPLPVGDSVWERYDRALYLQQQAFVERESFAATACLFTRREVFDRVGRFDPGLRSSGDWEWCRRAVRAGCTLVYEPAAVVEHLPRTTAVETWRLHRRLGAGWAVLARRGERPSALRDPALFLPLGAVVDAVAADGPPLRRRHLAPVHALATTARLVGRLTGR
jgi:GT2 family glycosyltransferase